MAEAVNPPEVWAPFGAFSMTVIQGNGRIVHLKGQVALDRDGQVVGHGDMRMQVRQTLDNIRAVLAAMGGQMQDVISLVHHAYRHRCLHADRRHPQHVFRRALSGDDDRPGRTSLPSRPADRDHRRRRNSARAFSPARIVRVKRGCPAPDDAPAVALPTGALPRHPRAYFACAPGFTALAAALSANGCHAAPSEYQSTRRVSVMMPARIANSSSEPSISALSSDSSSP